ncbi:Hydantoin racemase [subsurface metagenome]
MRIAVVQVTASEEKSEGGQFCKVWADLMRRNIDLVKQKDTEVTFLFPRWGLTGLDAFFHTYLHRLNDSETFHTVVRAEKEGFDAAILTCFYDPMLRELRQAVNIPVVSIGEASLLLALMMGAKLGVVTVSPEAAYDHEELIDKYGLRQRAVRIRPIPETAEEQPMALMDAHHGIEAFKKVARELIADGADVLIPACGLMSPALRLAPGAEKEYPNGLTKVDGVPVMDVLGATVKMAETLVNLKQAGSSWISRKAFYAQATPKAKEFGQMVLKYDGPGYWSY